VGGDLVRDRHRGGGEAHDREVHRRGNGTAATEQALRVRDVPVHEHHEQGDRGERLSRGDEPPPGQRDRHDEQHERDQGQQAHPAGRVQPGERERHDHDGAGEQQSTEREQDGLGGARARFGAEEPAARGARLVFGQRHDAGPARAAPAAGGWVGGSARAGWSARTARA
jgi:hypothetical protein